MEPTRPQKACFEAGIKFGTLYHQFAGTPVTPESAESLATAMAEAIENQPYCQEVRVSIDTERLESSLREGAGETTYGELTGEFFTATIEISYENTEVTATMDLVDGYPRMELEEVRDESNWT